MYYYDPAQYILMPKCLFKLLTGLSCPGCGIQRAIHALVHGHIKEAIHYNYYLIYSAPYALSFLIVWAMPTGRRKLQLRCIIENRQVVNFYIITFLVWFVLRNLLNI